MKTLNLESVHTKLSVAILNAAEAMWDINKPNQTKPANKNKNKNINIKKKRVKEQK